MKSLIQKLVELVGPSGYEQAVRDFVRGEIQGSVDEIRVDALGNLIARKGIKSDGGPVGGLRIMLSAHMDEIGFLVKFIDEDGFLRLHPIGGHDPRNMVAQRVAVHGKRDPVVHDAALPISIENARLRKRMKDGPICGAISTLKRDGLADVHNLGRNSCCRDVSTRTRMRVGVYPACYFDRVTAVGSIHSCLNGGIVTFAWTNVQFVCGGAALI